MHDAFGLKVLLCQSLTVNASFVTVYFSSFHLPKHPSAAQMLRDVGAVDFLTQLSPNVEPRLRAVIDGTLDQLFQLPELLPSHALVYSHGQHTAVPTGVTSYGQIIVCYDPPFYKLVFITVCREHTGRHTGERVVHLHYLLCYTS